MYAHNFQTTESFNNHFLIFIGRTKFVEKKLKKNKRYIHENKRSVKNKATEIIYYHKRIYHIILEIILAYFPLID